MLENVFHSFNMFGWNLASKRAVAKLCLALVIGFRSSRNIQVKESPTQLLVVREWRGT